MATILVVDDNAPIRSAFSAVLTAYGYTVHTTDDGEEALQMVADHEPDLILLDIMMPVMSGWEVKQRLDQNPISAAIPVIAVTALAGEVLRTEPGWDRFTGYLQKPVLLPNLIGTLQTALSPRSTTISAHVTDTVEGLQR